MKEKKELELSLTERESALKKERMKLPVDKRPSNFYINKSGELIERFVVSLPYKLVERLRQEGFFAHPKRKKVSIIIKERLIKSSSE